METKTRKKHRLQLSAAVGAVAFIVLFALLQALLVPKYVSASPEGNLIAEYYDEKYGHDVIFIGDCEVYESFSPVYLWEQYGITSYIRGSSQQLIWQSYYLLEETFRHETPKVVVFNVLSMEYGVPQKEAYNRMTLDGMRLSAAKIDAVKASMMENETLISYLFPLLRFHSRWSDLSGEDVQYMFSRPQTASAGYLIQTGIRPAGSLPAKQILADYSFSDVCWQYLDDMRELCEENGAELILIKAPSLYPYWYDEWDAQIEDYAAEHDLEFINFLDVTEEIGLDYSTDTYDGGLHLNVTGAEKLTEYFGKYLAQNFEFEDHSGDAGLISDWEEKAGWYHSQIQQKTNDNAG